jgi:hypothetical protein
MELIYSGTKYKLAFSKLPAGMLFVRKSGTILGFFTFKWLRRMSIFVK